MSQPNYRRHGLGLLALLCPACLSGTGELAGTADRAPAKPPAVIQVRASDSTEPARQTPLVLPAVALSRPSDPDLPPTPPVPKPAPEIVRAAAEAPPAPPQRPAEGPLAAALQSYLSHNADEADLNLRRFDPAARDLLRCLLPLAVAVGEGGPAGDLKDKAAAVECLQSLLAGLRGQAPLQLGRLCFRKPTGLPVRFGVYDPLPDGPALRPGDMADVYVEVKNFTCSARDGRFDTHLRCVLEIRDSRGRPVAPPLTLDKPDSAQAPRQDYFQLCQFAVPALAPGVYTVNLQVCDVPTARVAGGDLAFRVGSPRDP